MVSIALRSYINDIGDMIDHQQIAESIAHSRHILETYPKHVDTYRLLGKAYLEEKRYGDASDILQRVLSSVPEDFIAHVGMSIIREDEGNLDAAIYHMERAFETQPSNHAIQDELRRLHANRDGIEPPRIRLTRGALARMYAHGHLFDQAIAELLAAISEDAQRFDLQTLLAEMYYQTGKKVDSAETCTKILEKLPYCLKANQLLTMILETNDRADDAQRYRQRWEALDPYAAFTDQENSNPEVVPDSKVEVERLEWEPESYLDGKEDQPAWASSLGVSLGREEEADEAVPAWLTSETTSDEEERFDFEREEDDFFASDKTPESQFFDDEEAEPAPEDWLRDTDEHDDLGLFAGEGFDSEQAAGADDDFDLFDSLQKPTAGLEQTLPDDRAESSDDDDDWMAEFAIPESPDTLSDKDETLDMEGDWLASLETTGDQEPAPVADAEPEEKPDWLTSFDTAEEETPTLAEGEPEEEPDWLATLETTGEQEPAPIADAEPEEKPDWLTSFDTAEEETPTLAEGVPDDEEDDWLASLGATDEEEPEKEPDDWLAAVDSAEVETQTLAEDVPDDEEDDWLASLGATDEEEPEMAEDDWLAAVDSAEEDTPASTEGVTDEEEDDWLASLGATDEEEPEMAADDWLAAVDASEEDKPAFTEGEPEEEEVELPDFLKEAGWEKTPSDADDTADIDYDTEEDLPEELEEAEIPDWIQELAPTEDRESSPLPSEVIAEADPEWLDEMDQQPTSPTPDWLSELDETAPELPTEVSPEKEEPVLGQEIEADDLDMAWLESLAAKQGIPEEELVTSPEQRADASERHLLEQTPEEEAGEKEVEDDWLAELGESEESKSDAEWFSDLDAQPEAPTEETPTILEDEDDFDMDWLDEIGQQAAVEAAASSLETAPASADDDEIDVDNWLTELETQPEASAPPEPEAEVPVDESAPTLEEEPVTSWLDEIDMQADEAEAEPPIETEPVMEAEDLQAEDDWLADLGESEQETETDAGWLSGLDAQPEAPTQETPPVLEDEDDFDMDWLDEIGQQAAEEAAETTLETAAKVEAEDQAEDDFLADLGEREEETGLDADWLSELDAQPEAPTQETPSVLEDEDDFDMDWLDEIGQQAAEEAAETTLEAAAKVEAEDQAEDDFLADLDEREEETGLDADWLSELDAQPEAPTQETPPVLEDEDDFDMDWLDEIGQQAAEEAAEEPAEEKKDEQAWLAELADQEQETASDWVIEDDTSPKAPAPPEGEAVAEEAQLVQEDEDDFDTGWLKSIGQEAAAEAAATSIEAGSEEDLEEVPDWLSDVGSKFDTEEPLGDDTMGRFLSGLEETEEEDEAGVQDFLSQLDQDETTPGDQAEIEDLISTPEEELEAFSLEDLVEPDLQTDEEIHLAEGDLDEFSADFEPATIEAEQEETPPLEETPEQVTAPTDEWQPESQMEEPPSPEVSDIPQMIDPESPQGILEAASKAADKGELDQALKGFSTLIKKGKLVEDVIREITEALRRHPVDVQLWQALGDAYMRIDDMQEALDAYTKAEELLR